jgi:hypothetical protein
MHRKRLATTYLLNCMVILLLFVLLHSQVIGQPGTPTKNLLIVKSTSDFTVTGDGSAANWTQASWNNLQQHGSSTLQKANWKVSAQNSVNASVHYNTSFKVLYSNKGIYCLFRCEDSLVTATLKEDYLNLFLEDVVEVFIRPDTSMPTYFEYELSPLNYELPIMIINNKGKIMGWRPWQYEGDKRTKHAVKISEKDATTNRITWTAEMFIPYNLLMPMNNVPPKKGTQWRANFYRIDYDRSPIYFGWQLTRRSFHDPERFGILQFE